jgi:ketosteroid isomerase-like protein
MKADSSNSPTRSSARASAARKAVLACERRLTTAERTGDGAELRTLLAADFTGLDLHGRKVDRAKFIAGFQRPELRLATLRIDQLSVRSIGPVAIVIGRSRFTGELAGRAISGTSRFMDTWTQRAGTWRLIASSVTRSTA